MCSINSFLYTKIKPLINIKLSVNVFSSKDNEKSRPTIRENPSIVFSHSVRKIYYLDARIGLNNPGQILLQHFIIQIVQMRPDNGIIHQLLLVCNQSLQTTASKPQRHTPWKLDERRKRRTNRLEIGQGSVGTSLGYGLESFHIFPNIFQRQLPIDDNMDIFRPARGKKHTLIFSLGREKSRSE